MAAINFDASAVSPDVGFGPIPAGQYIAQIVDSDLKTNRAGTGQYISLQFEILDGEFKGRRVFSNLTISHTNKTAEQIGQAHLSALCRAAGVMQLTDTAQLHGRPIKITVRIRKDEKYGESNEVTGFEPAAIVAQSPAAAAAAPAASTPPWER